MEPFSRIFALIWVRFNGVDRLRKGHRVFLFGAFGGRRYGDNSAVLFEHMVKNHTDLDCYWVMRRDAYAEYVGLGRIPFPTRVVFKDSVRANLLALIAETHIYSHGHYDVTDYSRDDLQKTYLVLLGHGVHALKKTTLKTQPSGQKIPHIAATADLVIAGSDQEARIEHEEWNIPKEKIVMTGLPRHDRLLRLSRETRRNRRDTILFMPTWRDWNSQRFSLRESEFFRQMELFLIPSGLDNYLYAKGIRLDLYVHMSMREFFDNFKKECRLKSVNLLPQTSDLQQVIADSALLVTDYSSICWDFLLLDKPVLFYQFDLEEYERHRGAYIDIRKDLFGPVAYNAENAVTWVRQLVENDFDPGEFKGQMEKMKKWAFAYRYDLNCERVASAILDRNGS